MANQNYYVSTTRDIDFISSGNDFIENTSPDDNPNKVVPSDQNYAVLLSNNDIYEENIEIDKDDDILSLSSSVSSIDESIQVDDECAVLLCNYYVRSHSIDPLFFIDFPKNNTNLRAKWWKICGRADKFDPFSKICSIHFNSEDFIIREHTRSGQRYRQTVLAYPGVIPTLFVHKYEFTQFTRYQKKKTIIDANRGLKCAVQGCKNKTKMLLFKFPLKNKELLKNWLNNIDLVNFQPLETDRICSEHFEKDEIAKINKTYILNKYAIPLIKPTHPYVVNSEDKKNKNIKIPIKKKNFEYNFDSDAIEFCKINEDVIMVKSLKNTSATETDSDATEFCKVNKDVIMVKNSKNKGATDLLSSLENNKKNLQQKYQNIQVQANSANVNDNNEKRSVIENSNNDNMDIEYVYIDALKNENIVGMQPKIYPNKDLKNEHKKRKLANCSSISAVNNIPMQFSSNELKNRLHMKSTERIIPTEKRSVIENSNNDNMDIEYVYIDALKNENIVGMQPKIYPNKDLKNEHKKRKLANCSSISAVNNIPMQFSSNELKNRLHMKSTERIIPTDKHKRTNTNFFSTISASNTSVNRKSNVLKKSTDKCISKYKYIKPTVPGISRISTFGDKFKNYALINSSQIKLTERNDFNETPKSIMFNKELTNTYGEMLPPYCNSDCKLQCYYHIPDPERTEIFDEFYKVGDVNTQNWKITQLVQLNTVKLDDGSIKKSQSYSLIMDEEPLIVCRTFFINTLGIPESRLDAILISDHYNWYSQRHYALQANQRKPNKVKPLMTNFVQNSLRPLAKDYDIFEPESDEETTLDNVPNIEFEKVIDFIKSIPRVLSKYRDTKNNKNHFFETSIHMDYMYKMYLDNYIKDNIPPPYTRNQFKKIYNQYMKTFLVMD